MEGEGQDGSVTLEDGRVLEYWEGGIPGGPAVIYHPGTPVTRLLGRWGHEAAVAAGVRLVSINRPGYGGSTSFAGLPGLMAVGRDTVELATQLGIDQLAVFGASGGGPFAVATAICAPGAVRALGVVAGIGPWRLIDDPSEDLGDRGCLALLDAEDSSGAWACFRQQIEEERSSMTPNQFLDGVVGSDQSLVVAHEQYRARWIENLRSVQANPDGYIADNIAWGGAWDVDPVDVTAPCLLWYGTADTHCSLDGHGRWYAERIRGSELIKLPGAGHFDVIDGQWPEVLAGLLRVWG